MSILTRLLRDLRTAPAAVNPSAVHSLNAGAKAYVELLKRCVGNTIYDDDLDLMQAENILDPATGKYIAIRGVQADAESKHYGRIWPSRAHTMIGMPRLDNLHFCVETVLSEGIAGDLIETGVWRGGASIFMRGILKAHGIGDRTVWVADSFEGLPPANRALYPKETAMDLDQAGDLAVSLEQVQRNFARYGLLDDQVRFLKGWFRDTLPRAPIERLALMRLDGDLYESTMDGLVNLYAKLSPGGFVIIDDFNALQSCNDAVTDFRSAQRIDDEMTLIEGCGAYWRKCAA